MGQELSGIHVFVYACGDVGGSQSPLSNHKRTMLMDFYAQLFVALGADSAEF